jgi:hypothetical protein
VPLPLVAGRPSLGSPDRAWHLHVSRHHSQRRSNGLTIRPPHVTRARANCKARKRQTCPRRRIPTVPSGGSSGPRRALAAWGRGLSEVVQVAGQGRHGSQSTRAAVRSTSGSVHRRSRRAPPDRAPPRAKATGWPGRGPWESASVRAASPSLSLTLSLSLGGTALGPRPPPRRVAAPRAPPGTAAATAGRRARRELQQGEVVSVVGCSTCVSSASGSRH